MKTSLAVWATVVVSLSFDANANLSTASDPNFGPGSLTYDSAQGLYWLSPTFTAGKSYLEVQALIGTDPHFSRYRFATASEAHELFADAGVPNIKEYGVLAMGTEANVPTARVIQSLLGETYMVDEPLFSLIETAGYVGVPYLSTVTTSTLVFMTDITTRTYKPGYPGGPKAYAYVASALSSTPPGFSSPNVGSFLVTTVPEPETFALFLGGLGILASIARNRHHL